MRITRCLGVAVLTVACARGDDDLVGAAPADGRASADGTGESPDAPGPNADRVDASLTPPDAVRIDAPLPADAAPSCVAAPSYPDVVFAPTDQAGGVTTDTGGTRFWYWDGLLGSGEPAILEIQLYPGYGAFASDPAPHAGTFPITAEETSYLTCGVCVLLFADLVVDGTGLITGVGEYYLADGGSVTLDRVDTAAAAGADAGAVDVRITGSFTGLTFNAISTTTAEPIVGGCRTAATHGTFDAALDPPP